MADTFSFITTPWFSTNSLENKDRALTYIMIVFLIVMILYSVAINGTLQSLFTSQANTLVLLALAIVSFSVMDRRPQIYASFGQDKAAMTGLLLGTFFGVILIYKFLSVIIPPMTSLSNDSILYAFYTALIIPFVEEKAFGQTLPFVLNKTFKNSLVVIGLTCLIFGLYHAIAYKADMVAIFSAITFRFIVMLGNGYLKTSTFGISMHYTNNILAVIQKLINGWPI